MAGRVGFALDALHWGGVCVLFAIGLASLVGWTSGHDELVRLSSAFAPVPFTTALALMALAIAQMLSAQDRPHAARIVAVIPAALGVVALFSAVLNLPPTFDRVLAGAFGVDHLDLVQTMAPSFAIGLVSAALGVYMLTSPSSRSFAIGLTIPIVVVSLPALVGYATNGADAGSLIARTGFAVQTAIALLAAALALGALSLAPGERESPRWIWMPVAVAVLLVSPIALIGERVASDDGAGNALLETVLTMGILIASALGLALSRGSVAERVDTSPRHAPLRAADPSDDLFRALALVAPVGIYVTDAHGRCLFVNELWCRLSGLTSDEATTGGWRRTVHVDDRERVLRRWESQAGDVDLFDEDYRFLTPDGRVAWVEDRATPLTHDDGRLAGYVGVVMDVGPRREAELASARREEAWRLVMDAQQGGVFEWEVESGDTRWSPRVYELLGLARDEYQPSPASFSALAYPEDRARLERALTVHLTTGAPLRLVVRLRRQSGEYRQYLLSARAARDADRRPIKLAGSIVELPSEVAVG